MLIHINNNVYAFSFTNICIYLDSSDEAQIMKNQSVSIYSPMTNMRRK